MDRGVRDRVADWGEQPVDGLDGVRDLADAGFSGVVERPGGTPWFAMLNGTVLGVHGGRIDDFDGEVVARPAPDPGVALLVAMLAADAEPEKRYYTEDTPVSQAHQTLSTGGFVGYLELSENVLSGDYYVAYYGDHSTPVAFVGSSDRLITGDDALERADDEVGIYRVYSVDLDVVELPGGPAPDRTAADGLPADDPPQGADGPPADTTAGGGSDGRPADAADPSGGAGADPDGTTGAIREDPGVADDGRSADPATAGADAGDTEYGSSTSYGDRSGDRSRSTADGGSETDRADAGDTAADRDVYSEVGDGTDRDDASGDPTGQADPGAEPGAGADAADGRAPGETRSGASSRSPADRAETGTTGAADRAREPEPNGRASGESVGGAAEPRREPDDGTAGRPEPPEPEPDADADRPSGRDRRRQTPADRAERRGKDGADPASSGGVSAATAALRERVEEHERRLAALDDRAASLEAADERATEDRQGLRAEVAEIAEELGDLRRTVVRLDRAVENIETAAASAESEAATAASASAGEPGDGGTGDGRDLSPAAALAETTLLLRYGSRGAPTLEAAHDDETVDRAAVEENLRVDVHTPFDDRTATVDGEPFADFIADRIEYRFFEWLVRDLLFEIRETGNQAGLRDLYDALPSIDRAELRSSVVVGGDGDEDEDEEDGERVAFDVVVRDAHERPLVVARINESRDPATEEMVVGLRDGADVVGEDADLAAAVSVTESYFSGTARDAAEEATADSILSRNSKESYVKLSRRSGYHLCLVAVGSDEEFHLRVPDL